MKNLLITLFSIFLFGCQTTSNSSYTKLQNYLAEPTELKFVVFAKSMWNAPDRFFQETYSQNLQQRVDQLLKKCVAEDVPKTHLNCKVSHLGNSRIEYQNPRELSNLIHIHELKNNPAYLPENRFKNSPKYKVYDENIEAADTKDVYTGIQVGDPYRPDRKYNNLNTYKEIEIGKNQNKIIVSFQSGRFFYHTYYMEGYSKNGTGELVEYLLKKCSLLKQSSHCRVVYLGNQKITYDNEYQLAQLIEIHEGKLNSIYDNALASKRTLDSITYDSSDVTILGPYKSMQLTTAKNDESNIALNKAKFRVIVALRIRDYSGLKERYFIGSSNISAHGLAASILQKCESEAHNESCKVRYLGNKVINYSSVQELTRLIEIYKKKQEAIHSTY